ncbi:GNAT family N-acetyltransferase [Nocardioides sp. cx-173]|uniref:GNAT family N-acetyltransferase n=1 Tax=Nocardioides sp. cx-173 TaxID=2898796 RepID=UPI001E35A41C|nr:GNAT family N-acetyltransferase [Nocardioides sp. cx-173]MCD4526217.1 GNAT family N-acetyltransferase [Nocardioides sp. cx-173]UGB40572.1 GNAT family N-acetyltransferase [Nocardioides sp. cx-173]
MHRHHAVRHARAADLRHLQAIEDAGVSLYEAVLGDLSGDPLASPGRDGRDRVVVPGFLLVTGEVGSPTGFAHVTYVEGFAHLAQLSVHPDHGRQGLGSALVHEAMREAWDAGFDRLSLTTYRDLPWNGPFYSRLGFVEVSRPEPFEVRQRGLERALGLDRHGPRVVMAASLRRALHP